MRPHTRYRLSFLAPLLAMAGAFVAGDALAWSAEGHRIVARIAEAGLTPAARAEVDRLLADEADPTLAGIAAWADELRDTDPEAAKASARWHYVNFQGRCAFDAAKDCPGNDCVIGAINRHYLALAQRTRPDTERRDALKYLVHFVGDAHQPLHAGLRDDAGGNRHQVNYKGDGSNMHRIWDGTILERRGLKSPAYAVELLARAPLPQDPTLHSQTPALDWALESCRIIETGDVYPPEGRHAAGGDAQPRARAARHRAGGNAGRRDPRSGFRARTVNTTAVPRVHPFHHAGTGTWSYVVADAASGAAAIIDPVLDFEMASGRTATTSATALVDCVRQHGYRVDWLLETHAHADHLSAAHWLKAVHFNAARIAIGEGIRSVQARFRDVFDLGAGFAVDGSQFDHLFAADEAFALGGIACRAIPVPGHTSDSNAYLIGDALFAGDSLFMPDAGTARCDFPGGSAATLYRSIQRLFDTLPDATRVFVCHDYGPGDRAPACETSIAAQKQANIHVRAGIDEDAFVATREARDATLAMPALLIPAVQVNIRAGALPEPHGNGLRYIKLPLDAL